VSDGPEPVKADRLRQNIQAEHIGRPFGWPPLPEGASKCASPFLPLQVSKSLKRQPDIVQSVLIPRHPLDEHFGVLAFPEFTDQGFDESHNVGSHFSSPLLVLLKLGGATNGYKRPL
jgi:hypothetical protein